jgi:plasmid partitioning protein RepB
MARKNLFSLDSDIAPADNTGRAETRPLAKLERPIRRSSPVGALSNTLGDISQKASRADELERRLAEGQAVVELDPADIDASIIVDRLAVSEEDIAILAEQIRAAGQQVPILVRPHPQQAGRYQVAYGHRRLAAVRMLNRHVKAVVRELTDEQLVVSQGQENNARTDLSFIERSYFAYRLEQRGFSRDLIMSAIGVDKAALSRMIALVERLPAKLIEFIGSAPSFGRTRWAELADLLENKTKKTKALEATSVPSNASISSDARFQLIYDLVRHVKAKPRTMVWKTANGAKAVRISETGDKLNLIFDKAIDPKFGAFVEGKLGTLYAEYMRSHSSTTSGE